MKCPVCRSSVLQVEVVFSGDVTCRFSSDDQFEVTERISLSSDWTDDSACNCPECGWHGVVEQARRTHRPARQPAKPRPPGPGLQANGSGVVVDSRIQSVAEVKHHLEQQTCDPLWQACIEFLIAEVERLHSLVESVRQLQDREQTDDSAQDTSLL